MLNDVAAERATLSAICQYGQNAWIDCRDILLEDCYTDHRNLCIFTCLEKIFKNNSNTIIDIASILSSAESLGLKNLGEVKEVEFIKSLFYFDVAEENAREFAKKIRKLSECRQLIGSLDSAANQIRQITGDESISEISALAERPIFDFTNKLMGNNQQTEQFGIGIDEYYNELYANLDNIGGISIGYPIYENAIGGLRYGVHVVAARKKTGKSFFALNAACWSAYKEKVPTLYLDTELQKSTGQYHRFVTRFSNGLTLDEIQFGRFLEDEQKVTKWKKAKALLKKIPFQYRNVRGLGIDEIVSIIRRWLVQTVGYNEKGELNKCLIVYDYLKPPTDMKDLKNIQETQEIGLRLGVLHEFTDQYRVPILTFSQMNREQDIAASDRISWYCTSLSTMRKKTTDEIAVDGPQNGNRVLSIEDVRHGEGLDMGDFVNFHFDGKYALLKELKTRNQVEAEKQTNATTTDGDNQ